MQSSSLAFPMSVHAAMVARGQRHREEVHGLDRSQASEITRYEEADCRRPVHARLAAEPGQQLRTSDTNAHALTRTSDDNSDNDNTNQHSIIVWVIVWVPT